MFDSLIKLLFGRTFRRNYATQATELKVKAEWGNIRLAITSKSPSQLKQALISADKCLDIALKDVFDGETMGDRLKNAKDRYDRVTYNRIWEAHKIRNNLVHEAGYDPQYFVLINAIEDLRMGLVVLGIRV